MRPRRTGSDWSAMYGERFAFHQLEVVPDADCSGISHSQDGDVSCLFQSALFSGLKGWGHRIRGPLAYLRSECSNWVHQPVPLRSRIVRSSTTARKKFVVHLSVGIRCVGESSYENIHPCLLPRTRRVRGLLASEKFQSWSLLVLTIIVAIAALHLVISANPKSASKKQTPDYLLILAIFLQQSEFEVSRAGLLHRE